ncbi:MAG TPA: hypothetical protein VKD91_10485 [Pyrinomonadaceae bacterium]|nr:hypothetical protein [Pyrinomonadaceae bacterium]
MKQVLRLDPIALRSMLNRLLEAPYSAGRVAGFAAGTSLPVESDCE